MIGPNNVKRPDYLFADHKTHMVEALNDMCRALDDIGVVGALHQHTGTCVETRDETYAVMEAVNTRYVKFGPDVGQLQKGGLDPVKVVKDFLPAIRHVHMKDYDGERHYLGYTPLGLGEGRSRRALRTSWRAPVTTSIDHGGAGSVERTAPHPARRRADQQRDVTEAWLHLRV